MLCALCTYQSVFASGLKNKVRVRYFLSRVSKFWPVFPYLDLTRAPIGNCIFLVKKKKKKKSVYPIHKQLWKIRRPGESTDSTAKSSYRTLRNPETPRYTRCADIALTCTHEEIISAKRDNDFIGYAPFSEGSTILANASISCSWGTAHLTRNCSPRGRDLDTFFSENWEEIFSRNSINSHNWWMSSIAMVLDGKRLVQNTCILLLGC